MLAKFMQTEYTPAPRIEKRCGGEDVSALGAFPAEVVVGGATIFVMNVEQFVKI